MERGMIITATSISLDQFRFPLDVIASEHNRQLQLCEQLEDLASNRRFDSLMQEATALLVYRTAIG